MNLGYIYTQQGKTNKAEEYFNRAVKKLIPYENDIHSLANKFRNIREYNWANKTYLKGRELLNRPLAFTAEMGDNYMMDRDYDNMFALFVEALLQNPEKLSTITSKLSFARSYDVNGNADKVIASQLEKIFRQKDYPSVFDELGVWYSLQTGDYTQAFNHAVKLNAKTRINYTSTSILPTKPQMPENTISPDKPISGLFKKGKKKILIITRHAKKSSIANTGNTTKPSPR